MYSRITELIGSSRSRNLEAHFGRGSFKVVKQLEIRCPFGARQVLKDLPAEQIHRFVEP